MNASMAPSAVSDNDFGHIEKALMQAHKRTREGSSMRPVRCLEKRRCLGKCVAERKGFEPSIRF